MSSQLFLTTTQLKKSPYSSLVAQQHSYSQKTNSIFVTLTYERNSNPTEMLSRCGNHFNRYSGRLRRKFGPHHYLRVIERHKDNYPHLHAHIVFPTCYFSIERGRYFDDRVYRTIKSLWPHGFTDCKPLRYTYYSCVKYTLKYLLKTTTANTLWRKLLSTTSTQSDSQIPADSVTNQKNTPIISESPFFLLLVKSPLNDHSLISCPLLKKRIKKLVWSRGYIEYLSSIHNNET